MDTVSVRKSLDVLASTVSGMTSVSAKVAVDTVDVARAAVAEVEKMQAERQAFTDAAREQFAVVEKAADDAIERAAVAANRLEYERKQVAKRRVSKRAEAEAREVEKACDQIREAFEKGIPEIVATLLAMRKRISNQHGKNPFQTTKSYGHWNVVNKHNVLVATCETRGEAMSLVTKMLEIERAADKKSTTELADLDVSLDKDWVGINDDRKEPPAQGGDGWNGAAAKFPGLDNGPKIADDEDD